MRNGCQNGEDQCVRARVKATWHWMIMILCLRAARRNRMNERMMASQSPVANSHSLVQPVESCKLECLFGHGGGGGGGEGRQ